MQLSNQAGGAVTNRLQRIIASGMAVVVTIGLAPQIAFPDEALADDGANTFTVQVETAQSGSTGGTSSASGDGSTAQQPAAPAGIAINKPVTVGTGNQTATVKAVSDTEVTYVAPKSSKAKKITVPATVTVNGKTYAVTKVAAGAFKNSKVQIVTIGKNVKTIGKNAFKGAKKLKKVTLGKNVKTIGKNAFKGAKKLKKVTLKSGKLTKSSFKNMLKGSKIKTIKLKGVSKKVKKKYKKWAKKYRVSVK